jgi:hypothetical protein
MPREAASRLVGFVFGVAAASRNTRFQAACEAPPISDLHRLIAPALSGAFVLVAAAHFVRSWHIAAPSKCGGSSGAGES